MNFNSMYACHQCNGPVDLARQACLRCGEPLDDERTAFFLKSNTSAQTRPEVRAAPAPQPSAPAPVAPQATFGAPAHIGQFGADDTLWSGRPNPWIGPIERRRTKFEIRRHVIRVTRGLFVQSVDQIPMYAIEDVDIVGRGPIQQWFKHTGNLVLRFRDKNLRPVVLNDVSEPERLQQLIYQVSQEQFIANGGRIWHGENFNG